MPPKYLSGSSSLRLLLAGMAGKAGGSVGVGATTRSADLLSTKLRGQGEACQQ